MASEKPEHAVELTIDDYGVGVALLHPSSGTCSEDRDADGRCVLEDWVAEVGAELFADSLTVTAPVTVEWSEADEPSLHFNQEETTKVAPSIREEMVACCLAAHQLREWADESDETFAHYYRAAANDFDRKAAAFPNQTEEER